MQLAQQSVLETVHRCWDQVCPKDGKFTVLLVRFVVVCLHLLFVLVVSVWCCVGVVSFM